MNVYDQIQQRYGFSLPEEYRAMERAGWFDAKNKATFVWVYETRWLTPEKILAYEFESFHKPGFVPFARTAASDLWCWWPAQDPAAVVLCPRDSTEASFDASSFVGSLYRRMLSYCVDFDREDEANIRAQLIGWAGKFAPYFPAPWIETLQSLSRANATPWQMQKFNGFGLLPLQEEKDLIQRDLGFARLSETFEWMVRR